GVNMSEEAPTAREGVEPEVVSQEAEPETVAAAEEEPKTVEGQEAENGEGEQEQVAEEVEFDFGGNKFRAPKTAIPENIANELDKFSKGIWSDYSRKSGEIAERARSLETREKVVEKLTTINDETLNTYSRGLAVKGEIEQLQKVDLNALWQSNPDQARRVSDALSTKQAEFQNIVSRVSQLEGLSNQAQQQEVARRVDEGKAIVEKHVPGFATKHLPEVIDYVVKNYGMSKDVAERDWPLNPATAVMAHKAMLYDRMQEQAKKAAKSPAPQKATPLPPMKGKGGPATKDVSHMSVSEMAKHLGLS
ncbi:MAG: hypothetical protein NUW21_12090, partial [Elusimicrobia bacterium]|nr:hypothetical protein [Elusimicrobiota bacterium]